MNVLDIVEVAHRADLEIASRTAAAQDQTGLQNLDLVRPAAGPWNLLLWIVLLLTRHDAALPSIARDAADASTPHRTLAAQR